ncbi:TPA: hypothetical protein DDW35_02645 [Candidatus Sumerlaeota bacterium]|jgi:hypothetical protein|nr:hypothetical protein [Candidatus Sumerlaeota bacterium]
MHATLPAPHETIALPKIYLSMYTDGLLNSKHPNGLHFSNIQWFTPDTIQNYASEENCPTLLPFARNLQAMFGAGIWGGKSMARYPWF